MSPDDGKLIPPWSPEIVDALNAYQQEGVGHPYTCGVNSWHGPLVATTDGWVCSKRSECLYRQNWAHAFSIETPDQGVMRQMFPWLAGGSD